jgi:hypothetical protein
MYYIEYLFSVLLAEFYHALEVKKMAVIIVIKSLKIWHIPHSICQR